MMSSVFRRAGILGSAAALLLASAFYAGLNGCSWKSAARPSVLVIMVENLGFGTFSCGEGNEPGRKTGFKTFCDEAVRFTHAYTPSLMSQSTVASILTAKYPYEHGVRHNGAQSLAAKEETFAEAALASNYHTAFFSGGAPLLRRSGLSQGFEVFDDNIPLSQRKIYRSAPEVSKLFLNWQESEAPREKFAALLYFADLKMIDTPTTNELGELRESSYRSQLDAVDEGLSSLIKEMKRRKIWDATDVVLVGLQSVGPERKDEIPAINLYSEGTRTTLMIKPARKVRDGPFNWKIDTNVSLVDLGATLFDIIGSLKVRKAGNEESGVHSLKAALLGPEPDWSNDRMIVSESAWPQWRYAGGIRAAGRRGPYLYIFDETQALFNTLTDNAEVSRLPSSGTMAVRAEFAEALKARGFQAWHPLPHKLIERASLAREIWRDDRDSSVQELYRRLKTAAKHNPDEPVLQGWRAYWALHLSDWNELQAASAAKGAAGSNQQPLWAYIAARNLGEKSPTLPAEPCLSFLRDFSKLSKDCRVEGWADLVIWANEALSEAVRTKAADAFFRVYFARELAVRIAEHNLMIGETDDSAERLDGPDIFDVLLALPELKKQRALVRARFAIEQGRATKE